MGRSTFLKNRIDQKCHQSWSQAYTVTQISPFFQAVAATIANTHFAYPRPQ